MAEMYHELSAVLLRLTLQTARQFCPVSMAAPIDLGERVGFDTVHSLWKLTARMHTCGTVSGGLNPAWSSTVCRHKAGETALLLLPPFIVRSIIS